MRSWVRLRAQIGASQREVSEATRVGLDQLRHWEAGDRPAPMDLRLALCEQYSIRLDQLCSTTEIDYLRRVHALVERDRANG